MPFLIELPYTQNGTSVFEPLADTPWAMWLDSGRPGITTGTLDVYVAFPRVTLVAHGNQVFIEGEDIPPCMVTGHPLDVLQRYLMPCRQDKLAGGAVGYFAYDLGGASGVLAGKSNEARSLPDMAVGIYDGFVVLDHVRKTCQIRAQDTNAGRRWARRMAAALSAREPLEQPPFEILREIQANLTPSEYAHAFSQVQAYIRAGDCYQINLAIRYSTCYLGSPWPAYLALRRRNPAPYTAWLNYPFAQVLSSSPESFLCVTDGHVTTRPIKGTRPRGEDAHDDAQIAAELAANPKDRAENLMIVDLLRNDLGKVCVPGSIHVPELFQVERYATVQHLVSTVEGRLAPGMGALDLLMAAFPGGSITGAPKRRAMQIITSLEPERRGVYCGAIGYIDLNGDMALNIAIRTLVCARGEAHFWAGGGLVADSEVRAEYQECQDKARPLREVLEGFRRVHDAAGQGS